MPPVAAMQFSRRTLTMYAAILSPASPQRPLTNTASQVVVTAACRSALTKGGKGGFKDTPAADILAGVLKAIIERSKINPDAVEDVCVGTVLAPGGGATEMRAASLVAGFPETTAVRTLNRQCSSGLQACVDVANQIKSGMIDVGIGAGVESMSLQYGYVSSSLWCKSDSNCFSFQTCCRDRVLRRFRE